jgi:DNA-binding NarL/FixJ family response regulator
MNSIAQELAGFYAIPRRQGRLVEPLGPTDAAQAASYRDDMTKEIKAWLARGFTRQTIAKKMGISPQTVAVYLKR